MEIYVVKQGDTVDSIAQSFDVPAESVIYNNQLSSPYRLAIGQALLVPSPDQLPERSIRTGGYAYSSIDENVLTQTLPWLSNLFVFSYGFTPEGYLIPPYPDDSFMIALAKDYTVKPVLSLTPRDSNSAFNNNLIHTVINDETKTAVLIESLTAAVLQKGFQGVDLDFEYIFPQDRAAYIAFVQKVREAINAIGYEVSVALAPKTSADQRGILYEGMDYPGLGEAADSVLLMTYEWGYT